MNKGLLRRICMAAVLGVLAMPLAGMAEQPAKGFLTGPDKGDPLDIAMRYINSQKSVTKMVDKDIADKQVKNRVLNAGNGVTHIYMRQRLDGIEVDGGDININVAKDGSIISMGDKFVRNLSKSVNRADPVVSAEDAVRAAARDLRLDMTESLETENDIGGVAQEAVFSKAGISTESIPVKLMYHKMEDGSLRLVWKMTIYADGEHCWDVKVDAESGAVLYKHNRILNDSYNVIPLPVESPSHGPITTVTNPWAPATNASPYGWHCTNSTATTDFTDTRGNNVYAQEDRDNNNTGGYRPDAGPGLIFTNTPNFSIEPSNLVNQAAAIVNLYYWNNICHDIFYQYGFDEVSGSFQQNNYGRGGLGGDAVQADAQDGSGVNNANFAPWPDGTPGRMQMYLFNMTTPGRDGDFDTGVMVHEYGHGVSTRLTGGPANSDGLNGTQSGGMGEGWSDWFALVFTATTNDTRTTSKPVGTYVLGQPVTGDGIRNFPYSTLMATNPLVYSYLKTNGWSEVHNAGEIWCATLWELYWNLVDAYGFNTNLYAGSSGTNGNNIAMRLVLDGCKLQPASPTMLNARDAILQADMADYGGANQVRIWQAFAKRGMGYGAYDGGNHNSVNVTNSFVVPDVSMTVSAGGSLFGPSGGPFNPTNFVFTLLGLSTNSVNWSAGESAAWLDLSATSGTLAPGATNKVTASLTPNAFTLTNGTYVTTVSFSNASGVVHSRDITLYVVDPLVISPSVGFTATGPYGGPFAPDSQVYTLSNCTAVSMNWTASKTANWLDVSVTNGTLAPGQVTNVTVALNTNANTVGVNSYTTWVTFNNSVSGKSQDRAISLVVTENLQVEYLIYNSYYALTFDGPVGGPFIARSEVFDSLGMSNINYYVFSNSAQASLNWTIKGDNNYISFPVSNGTLAGYATQVVTVVLNTNVANSLSAGTYSTYVTISNVSAHTRQTCYVKLRVGVDNLCEKFAVGAPWPNYYVKGKFDLAYQTITYTPDGSINYYKVTRKPAGAFPTDPNSTNRLVLDYPHEVPPPRTPPMPGGTRQLWMESTNRLPFFGEFFTNMWVCDSGYINFQSANYVEDGTYSDGLNWKQIMPLFDNQWAGTFYTNNITNCVISALELSDRVAITFQNMSETLGQLTRTAFDNNNYQVEMFYDGRIRITYLNMDVRNQAVIGLSRGAGYPPGFVPSDFSAYPLTPGVYAIMTSPSNDLHYILPTNITFTATVITNTAPVTNVIFYSDGVMIGNDATAPYAFTWTNALPGRHAVAAIAQDSLGVSGDISPPVYVRLAYQPTNLTWRFASDDSLPWDMVTPNWKGDDDTYADNANVAFISFNIDGWTYWTNNPIEVVQTVMPRSMTVSNSLNDFDYTFNMTGGDIGGTGRFTKVGNAYVYFNGYGYNPTFSGGSIISNGLVIYAATTNEIASGKSVYSFGTGPITLDGGKFKFLAGVASGGYTNALANDFIVTSRGGTLNFNKAAGSAYPKIVFPGNFTLQNNATLTLDPATPSLSLTDTNGIEITGTISLNGMGTVKRATAADVYFSLSGNIVDGTGSGTLVVSNVPSSYKTKNFRICGTGNTYSGGTIIANDNSSSADMLSDSVEVAANSRLGTGDVTVQGGGLLRLTGSGNISTNATLAIQVSGQQTGVVWVASGITTRVAKLVLGSVTNTSGLYGANTDPAFLPGPGFIQVGEPSSNYLLTVQANNPAWGSVSPTGGTYAVFSNVQITATPSNHYHFVSWTGDVTSVNNPTNVMVNAQRTVAAVFAGDPLTLSVSSAYGTPSPGGTVTNGYGSALTPGVNSPIVNGITQFVCNGWTMTGNEPQTGTNSSFGMTLTNNAVLTWLWTTNIVLPPTLPFSETFETSPATMAGTLGAVNGQHGWVSDATNNVVTTGSAHGGTQSLAIGTGTVTHVFDSSSGTVFVSYWAIPSAGTTNTTVPANASAVFWVNSSKQVVAYSNAQPVVAGGTVNTGVWNRFDITCDYTSHVWSLSVNGTNVLQNFGFYSSQSAFSGIQFINSSTNTTYLDDVNISNAVAIIPPVYFSLTVNGMAGGSVNPTGGVYLAGSNVQISATADQYYSFVVWTGAVNSVTNPESVLMDTDKVVNAVFTANLVTNNTPAWWLAQYNLATNDAGALSDTDLDGLPAWQEYIAGTVPTNAASVFQMTGLSIPGPTIIRWSAVSGRVYTVYWTSNLLNGFQQTLGTNVPWTGNIFTDSTHNAEQQGFYQIKVRMVP